MRTLFYKLYDLTTAPLYRRLHRELSLQLQEIMQVTIEHHEATTRKLLDELLHLTYVVEGGEKGVVGANSALTLSISEIEAVVEDIDKSVGAIEVCKKHQLPLSTIFQIRSKFSGMNLSAIQRAQQLEQEHEKLSRLVEDLTLENKRLAAVKQHSPL